MVVKKQTHKFSAKCQRGNALFLILIAVALFAALSYAITQSGRGGGTINKEQAAIDAARITQFPSGVRAVLTRMIVTGTSPGSLDFDTAATGTNAVFAPEGGGATYMDPPSNIGNAYGGAAAGVAGAWGFGDLKDAINGYYITDIGTNTDISGREALAYLHDISLAVCQQINKGLGLNQTPQSNASVNYTLNSGSGSNAINKDNTFDAIPGQPFACVDNSGLYDYYHALIEQ